MPAAAAETIWLAAPSRYAGWSRRRARAALAVLVLLIAAFTIQPIRPAPPPGTAPVVENKGSESDLALYEAIVDDVRHGEDYYQATAQELRARPGYPLRPFVTFRLPLLARLQALLSPAMTLLLLWLLAAATATAWMGRLRELLPRLAPRLIAGLLLAGGLVAFVQPALTASHEIWAALLIAWSLAVRRPGNVTLALALATIAMLIRETAALYVLVMGGLAVVTGQRREAAGWALTLAVLAAAVAVHAGAVHRVTGPLDTASDGWTGLNGAWFFAMTLRHATILEVTPFVLAAPVLALALFGWTVPAHPLALRMATILAAYGVLIACFARLNNFYWGLMVAPIVLVGLAFVPDGLRDLGRSALDRRRARVTRTAA
ncbi:hypothetical protein F1C10_02060 [Sphingomonas sp. NBWT7]|uniref:hypothetical protein n=1 Tax=Sphingomonas sp. NBWT7 TaxID=2596913 RepID=UPI0016238BFD|nr:hypothetical protein [Sphingomonas sp. NBWT7]QNE30872.1 hypothetical protein F1C10_02060 [Sphingomonas sp. NBWT7]